MPFDWYKGDISAAIAEAKDLHANFVAFVTWEDEYSKFYGDVLNGLDLSKKLYIAIRIEAYTEAFEQLKAIYRVVPVPCVLVIDWESGMVICRIAGPEFDEELQKELLDSIPNSLPKVEPKPEPDHSVIEEKIVQTKIQLKLPSGEIKTQFLAPDDTLGKLRKAAISLFQLKGAFDLAVPYPRRVLAVEQDSLTLEALTLGPSSTVLVIPHERDAGNFFLFLLRSIQSIFQGWWQLIFPRPQPKPPTPGKKTE